MDTEKNARGTLSVVATPIGNLEDITLRALRTLKEADLIAAEDTRHTRKLLAHYDIHTPMVALHEHSTDADRQRLVARMESGAHVALVSDAGTPGVSDPGPPLVALAVAAEIPVVPVPGASAVLTALVGSGVPMDRFRFVGFLSRQQSQRRRILKELARAEDTLVFYEAPHRLAITLADMAAAFGPRPACAARELTKIHEEFIRATLDDLPARLPDPIRGEWTLIVSGAGPEAEAADEPEEDWREELAQRLAAGESSRDAARAISESRNVPRKEAYAEALAWKSRRAEGA